MYMCMGGRLLLDVSLALGPVRDTHRNTENDIEIKSMVTISTRTVGARLQCIYNPACCSVSHDGGWARHILGSVFIWTS